MEVLLISKSNKVYKTYPYHAHRNWEIILCGKGEGNALIAGKVYQFKPGTIFCIPPGVPHKKTAADGYTDGCIFIDGLAPITAGITICQDDAASSFQRVFDVACENYLKNGPNAREITKALVTAMYQLLVGWCEDGRRRNPAAEEFEKLLIDNIPNCDFDLTRALDKVGYSRNHFRSLFQAYTGMTPVEYLRHIRIEYAKQQLRQNHGVITIAEAARLSGFSDPYYFSRVFSRHEGMSPREFVKSTNYDDTSIVFGSEDEPEDLSDPIYERWHELVKEK